MRAMFLVNARGSTLISGYLRSSRCGGYLFPPDAATRLVVAQLASRSRTWVLADNGAYNEIGKLARIAVSHTGPSRWQQVVSEIRAAAAKVNPQGQLNVQLSVSPDAIIGWEDVTVAAWLRAGVSEEILRRARREIARRNAHAARMADAIHNGGGMSLVLPVASAHDYDTAFDAGNIFARSGVRAIAMGFGAFMADDQWTATVKIRGRVRRIRRPLPARYLRTALVARGVFDGWNSAKVPAPEHFHFLGLGAPIMLPIAMLAARECGHVSFDATSPIRDAVAGSIYVSKPATLTVKTWNVVDRLLHSGGTWSCPCRFCRVFLAEHPFDVAGARAVSLAGSVSSSDLRPGSPLSKYAPLFRIGTDKIGREAEAARIGHNHWVLGGLSMAATKAWPDIEAFASAHVVRYIDNAGAPHFAEAVQLAFDMVSSDGNFV